MCQLEQYVGGDGGEQCGYQYVGNCQYFGQQVCLVWCGVGIDDFVDVLFVVLLYQFVSVVDCDDYWDEGEVVLQCIDDGVGYGEVVDVLYFGCVGQCVEGVEYVDYQQYEEGWVFEYEVYVEVGQCVELWLVCGIC